MDDKIKCVDSQIKSNVSKSSVGNQNENDATSIDKMFGSPIQSDVERQYLDAKDVQSNEKNFIEFTVEENQCEGI